MVIVLLIHFFSSVSHFYTPWKRQKTKGLKTFEKMYFIFSNTVILNAAEYVKFDSTQKVFLHIVSS